MNKEDLKKRIKTYASATTVVLAAGESEAQVVYTDISPDFVGGAGVSYFLDINNDAVNDFEIYNTNSNLYIKPLNSSNEVLGSYPSYPYAYPYALNLNDPIDFNVAGSWVNYGYYYGYQSLNYGSGSFGNWVNVQDKYLGLHVDVGGQAYFGWARLNVGTSGNSWTVKDYAFEATSNATIYAGIVVADTALNVMASDIGDMSDGSDMRVEFDSAQNEIYIQHYRVMVVKASKAATFDLSAADAVTSGNYLTVPTNATAASYSVSMGGINDTDGDPIEIGVPYEVFVYSRKNNTNTSVNALAQTSSSVTLNTPASLASLVNASDISENGDGSDLEVEFTAAPDESKVGEYRIMVVKTANAGSFDVASAGMVTSGNYTAVSPNASPTYTQTLGAMANDVDGDAITNDVPYTVFVYSDTTGVTSMANIPNLSSSTAEITLKDYTGIKDLSVNGVFLNYFDGEIRLGELDRSGGKATLTVFNSAGAQVVQYRTRGNDSFDVSKLPGGTYIIRLDQNGEFRSEKFVR